MDTINKDLEVIKKDGLALQYVKNQTDEICLAAVTQNGWALRFVENRTYKICYAAVNQCPKALLLIKDKNIFNDIIKGFIIVDNH